MEHLPPRKFTMLLACIIKIISMPISVRNFILLDLSVFMTLIVLLQPTVLSAAGNLIVSPLVNLIKSDETDVIATSMAGTEDTVIIGFEFSSPRGRWSGAGYIFEKNHGGSNNWGQVKKIWPSDAVLFDRFGKAMAISGDTVVGGAWLADPFELVSAGAAYVFERNHGGSNNWGQSKKLIANDRTRDSFFGSEVAIHKDTIAISGTGSDLVQSVYIFERNQNGTNQWGQTTRLTPATGELFGVPKIRIFNDLIWIGNRSADQKGAVFMFQRDSDPGIGWTQVAKIVADDGASGDLFGTSIAYNGSELSIGAIGDDDMESSSGSVYIFSISQSQPDQWTQLSKITATAGGRFDQFGTAIGMDGDVLAISAPGKGNGTVYIFNRDASASSQWIQSNLVAQPTTETSQLGQFVSLENETVSVSTLGSHSSGEAVSGVVFSVNQNHPPVLDSSGEPFLTSIDEDDINNDGTSVSDIITRLGGIGITDIDNHIPGIAVISVDDSHGTWEFKMNNTVATWVALQAVDETTALLLSPDAFIRFIPDENFNGPVDQAIFIRAWDQTQGVNGMIFDASSPANDSAFSSTSESVKITVNSVNDAPTLLRNSGIITSPESTILIDNTKLQAVDVDTDNTNEIIYRITDLAVAGTLQKGGGSLNVGETFTQQDINNNGISYTTNTDSPTVEDFSFTIENTIGTVSRVFTFLIQRTLPNVFKISAQNQATSEHFGDAMAVHGDILVVGVGNSNVNGIDSGAAYVYNRDPNDQYTWLFSAELLPNDPFAGNQFGIDVAINGNTIVIASANLNGGQSSSGAAYVFNRSSVNNQWAQTNRLVSIGQGGHETDKFGNVVAVRGNVIMIGAPGSIHGGLTAGKVYVFNRSDESSSIWQNSGFLTASKGVNDARFGDSLAINGERVIIGAPGDLQGSVRIGAAYLFLQNEFSNWVNTDKFHAGDGMADDNFGNSVDISGGLILIGADKADDQELDAGAAYVFRESNSQWIEDTKITIPDSGTSPGGFGNAVSIHGNTIVVGKSIDNPNDNKSGSAYVFERIRGTNDTWSLLRKLYPQDGMADDLFSKSVAISGRTVFAGSPGDDGNQSNTGSVYIFPLQGQSNHAPILDSSGEIFFDAIDEDNVDSAGLSVSHLISRLANSGISDEDGNTVGIGVTSVDTANGVWQYKKDQVSAWKEITQLTENTVLLFGPNTIIRFSPLPDFNGIVRFAFSFVAWDQTHGIPGTFDDIAETGGVTGFSTDSETASIVVNSINDAPKITINKGLVLTSLESKIIDESILFSTDVDTPFTSSPLYTITSAPQQGTLRKETLILNVGDTFSQDDIDSGQILFLPNNELIIDDSFSFTLSDSQGMVGSLETFSISTPKHHFLENSGEDGDRFGFSVAIDGKTAVIGVPRDDNRGLNSGSAFVYQQSPNDKQDWVLTDQLFASDAKDGDRFGRAVAIFGDTIVVGAFLKDGTISFNSGAAYVFQRINNGEGHWIEETKLTALAENNEDAFGISVAIDGESIIVGAFTNDDNGADSGTAYIFQRDSGSSTKWRQIAKLFASDGATKDSFGFAVDINGNYAVVGARFDGDDFTSDSNGGAAYIYNRDTGGTNNWGEIQKLQASDAEEGDHFGFSVAIENDILAVGARFDDDNGLDSGAVYIFKLDTNPNMPWQQVEKIIADDGQDDAWFGASVAIGDDVIIIGAPGDDVDLQNRGRIHIFSDKKNSGTWLELDDITSTNGHSGDQFGRSVSVTDTSFVVGADGDTSNGISSGSAYFFEPNLQSIIGNTLECPEDVMILCSHSRNPDENIRLGKATTSGGCSVSTELTFTDNESIINGCTAIIERVWALPETCNVETTCTQRISVIQSRELSLDIDGSSQVTMLTDGLLIIHYLSGLRGEKLVESVVAPSCSRCTAEEIASYLNLLISESILDIDTNGLQDKSSDGMVILRYLAGFRGEDMIQNLVTTTSSNPCSRCDPDLIKSYIEGFLN